MKIKLSLRLIIGYCLPIIGLMLIGLFGILSSREIQAQLQQVTAETVPMIEALDVLRAAGLRIVSSTNEMALLQRLDVKDQGQQDGESLLISAGMDSYDRALKQYESLVMLFSPDNAVGVKAISDAGQQLQSISKRFLNLVSNHSAVTDVLEAKEQFEQQEQAYLKLITDALEHENSLLTERQIRVAAEVNQAQVAVGGGIGGTLILTLLMAIAVTRSILNPLEHLMQVVRRIDKGDYEVQVPLASDDELEKLGRSINTMSLTVKRREKELNELNHALERDTQSHAANLADVRGRYARLNNFINNTLDELIKHIEQGTASSDLLELVRSARTAQTGLNQS